MVRRGATTLSVLVLGALGLTPLAHAVDRPTETGVYSVPEHSPPHCTERVCVHWVESTEDAPDPADGDGNGVPDAVERTATAAELALARQTDPPPSGMGWPGPRGDGTLGGGHADRTDLYLAETGGGAVAYPDNGAPEGGSVSGFVLLDEDAPAGPADNLRDLLVHELNHVICLGINLYAWGWLSESTAVWMEEHAEPAWDLWLRYMPTWASNTDQPLTSSSRKGYGDAVWHHWLDARYGVDIVRDIWDRLPRDREEELRGLGATDAAIRARGGPGFAAEFAAFATGVPEWRVAGHPVGARAPLPDAERLATLSPGGPAAELELWTPGFALLDVPPPAAGVLRLDAHLPAGHRGAIALVARAGDELTGTVTTRVTDLPEGGDGVVTLDDPGRFARITAVLVDPDTSRLKWSGEPVDRAVSARVTASGDPPPREPEPAVTPAIPETTSAAAPTAQPPPSPSPPATTIRTPPDVRLRVARRVRLATLLTGLRITLSADRASRAVVRLAGARRTVRLTRGAERTVRIRATRAVRRRLARRAPRRFQLTLRVRVTDAAGNARSVERRIAVRR